MNTGQPGENLCLSGTFSTSARITISDANDGFTLRSVNFSQPALVAGTGTNFTVFEVHGDAITFQGFEVTGAGTRNCFLLGNGGESAPLVANDLSFDHMRIHACGNDNHEHALYVEFTNRLHVTDSWLYAAGGYGLHFYPEANDSLVEYSIVDGNDTGSGWAGNVVFAAAPAGGEYTQPHASDGNIISQSLITFVSPGSNTQNINTDWPPVGIGNEVRDSCIWSPGDVELARVADPPLATLVNPTRADPLYANRALGDFTLLPGSPCLGKGPR